MKEALALRQSIEDEQSEIPSSENIQSCSDPARNAVKNVLEQEVGDYRGLFIHAFKMSRRILNQLINPGPHPCLLYYLLRYAKKCFYHSEYEHVIDISKLILDLETYQRCHWENFTKSIRKLIFATFGDVIMPALKKIELYTEDVKELTVCNVMIAIELAIEFAIADATCTLAELTNQRTKRSRLKITFLL